MMRMLMLIRSLLSTFCDSDSRFTKPSQTLRMPTVRCAAVTQLCLRCIPRSICGILKAVRSETVVPSKPPCRDSPKPDLKALLHPRKGSTFYSPLGCRSDLISSSTSPSLKRIYIKPGPDLSVWDAYPIQRYGNQHTVTVATNEAPKYWHQPHARSDRHRSAFCL